MPIGFNSSARNLFLLGSTGAQVVTNFFKRIDQTSTPYNNYEVRGIKYNTPDQKYILSGQKLEPDIFRYTGWIEKRSTSGSLNWSKTIGSTGSSSLNFGGIEIDSNYNIIACGRAGQVPYVRKYSNSGSLLWSVSSSNSGGYFDVAIDDSDNIYVCGVSSTDDIFIEKLNPSGSYLWGRTISNAPRNIALNKCAVNNRQEIICVGQIEDETKTKGYIVKIDTNTGNILWDRTLENPKLASLGSYWQTQCSSVYIDNNDQIYVVGYFLENIETTAYSFIIKYSPEGNIIWQKETNPDDLVAYFDVRSDTETEQTVAAGLYFDVNNSEPYLLLSKYSRDGSLIWRRKLNSNYDPNVQNYSLALDADPSFYYLLFTDDLNQEGYVFGKVSTSGNGLGNFTYSDGIANVFYNTSNIADQIGRITDGSVRNDTSDLITYPFEANKLMFDDLATQIANKKVQLDGIGTYSSSSYTVTGGYPRISGDEIVYGSNLLLNYDFANTATYPGTGTSVNNLSSTSHTGTINGATFNSAGYFEFPGSLDQRIYVGSLGSTEFNNLTILVWFYPTSVTNYENVLDCNYNVPDPADGLVKSGNIGPRLEMNNSGNLAWNWGASRSANDPFFSCNASNTGIVANTWYHSVLVINGNQAINGSTYLNGIAQNTGSQTAGGSVSWYGGIGNLVLGDGFILQNTGIREFTGRIGEVQIYNRVLTAQEISKNFNATRAKYGV